jgi:beta-ureidopropionase
MKARVTTICQGGVFYNSVEGNRKYVMRLLDLALKNRPDVVCLPETFTTASVAEESNHKLAEKVPGSTTLAVAERAKKHECYVICPIRTERHSRVWNSAVVIDRAGEVLGIYDKVHPVTSSSDYTVFEKDVTPGLNVPVFELDFGRVGIQICFDIGFPETWEELAQKGARLVFWPSAYNGGFPLQVYAYLHHYYVVSSTCSDKSRIIDPCGRILAETDRHVNVVFQDINLDYVVSHHDFNYSIPDRILAKYGDNVRIRSYADDEHFMVEPLNDSLSSEQLKKEFGFESVFQYLQRHREAYKMMSQGKKPLVQKAPHGNRPQYAKES